MSLYHCNAAYDRREPNVPAGALKYFPLLANVILALLAPSWSQPPFIQTLISSLH